MFARRVWGIDLGRSAVKGVLLSLHDGRPQILQADIVPLAGPPPDASQDPSRDGRVWKALHKFRLKHRPGKCAICVAIPAQNTFMRELQVAQVGRRKVEQMVRYEASNEIPFILDEVVWDYTLFDPEPNQATRDGLLLAVRRNVVETYVRVFRQLEVGHMDLITLAPLALLNLVRFELGEQARALLVDVGAQNTVLAAVAARRLWVRNALVGGNRLTALMQAQFDLDFEAAQQAKETLARSRHAKQALAAVRPGVHEVLRHIKTNLTHLERSGDLGDLGPPLLLGGGARLPGLKKQVAATLQREVGTLDQLQQVGISADADADFVNANLDRLAVAVGAGLCGLGHDAVGVTFLPRGEVRVAKVSRAKGLALAVGLAVWAAMLTLSFFGLRTQQAVGESLNNYKNLAAIVAHKDRELRQAADRSREELALRYLLAAARGRNQIAALVNDTVAAFAATTQRGRYHFRITSFRCHEPAPSTSRPGDADGAEAEAPVPSAGAPPADTLVGHVNGHIYLPRGGDPSVAYRLFARELMGNLRARAAFTKATGQASFTKGERRVKASGQGWPEAVRAGDLIRALPDGEWAPVESVVSATELTLTEPFAHDDFTGQYAICRVVPAQFNTESLEFTVQFEVSRAGPPDLAELLEPKGS